MPDWLTGADALTTPLSVHVLAVRLGVALLLGLIVAAVYRLAHGRRKNDSQVMVTTVALLCVLIAMVSMVIGNSVARAFSLVGALSIVRFRTVVDDTRDTAFVIFSVVVGMAAGAGLFLVPLVGVPLVAATAIALSWWKDGSPSASPEVPSPRCQLTVRLNLLPNPEQLLAPILQQHLSQFRLDSASTARQGSALDLVYEARLAAQGNLPALVLQLNQVEGVQQVEIRER